MKKTLIFGLGAGILILLFAGVTPVVEFTDKFEVKFWNESYWAKGKFPDSSTFELKSKDDLLYSEWKQMIKAAWEAQQEPPDLPILHETADYAIRDPNDGDLVLEWKADDARLTVTKKNLPALIDATKKMGELMP